MVNPRIKNLDFRVCDSNILFMLRVGIPKSMGNLLEVETRKLLVCGFLVRELTVQVKSGNIINQVYHDIYDQFLDKIYETILMSDF